MSFIQIQYEKEFKDKYKIELNEEFNFSNTCVFALDKNGWAIEKVPFVVEVNLDKTKYIAPIYDNSQCDSFYLMGFKFVQYKSLYNETKVVCEDCNNCEWLYGKMVEDCWTACDGKDQKCDKYEEGLHKRAKECMYRSINK